MLLALFKWWYGSGWIESWRDVPRQLKATEQMFAMSVLLRNLFSPWKQIITPPGRSLDEKFRAMIDNLISRVIGFFVRLGTIIFALGTLLFFLILRLAAAIAWPLLPAALIYCVIRAVVG